MNFKDIPIIIQSRDRLSCLQEQIKAFSLRGYNNIHILDVESTYPPLLEYYKILPYEIIRFPHNNYGHTTFISSGEVNRFNHNWYAYTDPDIIPVEECPDDFMEHFWTILQQRQDLVKAGFGLKIDDIPEHYPFKDEMIGWEKQFWMDKIHPFNAFRSPIDTTFALCRPGTSPVWAWAARTGEPYVARHTSWYMNPKNMSEEDRYYYSRFKGDHTHWSLKNSSLQ